MLAWELKRQYHACSKTIPPALSGCYGLEDYLNGKKGLLEDCIKLYVSINAHLFFLGKSQDIMCRCEVICEDLGLLIPGLTEAVESEKDEIVLDDLAQASGGLDWAQSLVGGGTEEPPDIYSMLAPRTEEELAAYQSDDEGGDKGPQVSLR